MFSRNWKKNLVLCSDNIGVSDCDIPRIHVLLLQQNLAQSRNINNDSYVSYCVKTIRMKFNLGLCSSQFYVLLTVHLYIVL
jgi:hypothetical protein